MKQRVHVFGASGSGTTTIAEKVCAELGYKHFDSDNYFWLKTQEPFTATRPEDECINMMQNDLSAGDGWMLSGSIANWGNALIPFFDLVVFVYVPQEIRVARLEKRELSRYGDSALPGGARYEQTQNFLKWAAAYDHRVKSGRSLQRHEAWLKQIECDVIRITNISLEESVAEVIGAIRGDSIL